jgi:hypothetical protein
MIHSVVHSRVLTPGSASPNVTSQESPGRRAAVTSGEGGDRPVVESSAWSGRLPARGLGARMSAGRDTLSRMRPALKPGLRWVWRDRDTLQIGIDSRRAVALTGMRAAVAVIGLLDGSRDRGQVIAAAAEHGIQAEAADRVIALLTAAGTLCDFPASTMATLPDDVRVRLASELATASLAHGDGDGGARVLVRRQAAAIRVHGTGPVGSCIASLLTASGIGRVMSVGPVADCPPPCPQVPQPPEAGDWPPATAGPAGTHRTAPAGTPRTSPAGTPRMAARGTPRTFPGGTPRIALSPGGKRPDLAVLVGVHDHELTSALVREHVPHLAASASEAIGVVGPLVVPGQSACLRCLDLARSDRDPAWPLILAQLAGGEPHPAACDAALATAVAAQAASQALAFVDRATPASAAVNGTLELVLPDWQWRRRTWLPHYKCSCSRH